MLSTDTDNGRQFGVAEPIVLEFGNRPGSYTALILFGSLFAVLGIGAWREIRRRAVRSRPLASITGVMLFAAPMLAIYVSSLSGFYTAEIRNDLLVLHYLHPRRIQLPLADVANVRVDPAFRGRWRLHIVRASGVEYHSATWQRDPVNSAADRLKRLIPRAP